MPAPKKRDDGQGSVYQMGDGRWRAEVTVGWERLPGGKRRRVRRYVYADSEKAAKRARNELLLKREQGELPVGDQVTLAGWLRYWLDEIAVHKVRPKTIESYRTLIEGWIIPELGHVRLRSLQPEHVEALQAAMRAGRPREIRSRKTGEVLRTVPAKPLAASTRLQAHHVLSRALKVAMQRDKVKRNVATLVDAPSVAGRRAEQYLTKEQARAFLTVTDERWNAARWSVALALGLRQGEALGLLWDQDVDLVQGLIFVQRQLQRRRGGSLELVPYAKTKSGHRVIDIPSRLLPRLRAHRKAQLQNRIALGSDWQGNELGDLVFTTRYGRPIEPRADYQEWRDILAEIGAPAIRLHAARHTAATLMLIEGVDPKVVAAVLGHSTMTITRDLYQHVVPEVARGATEKVGEALWG